MDGDAGAGVLWLREVSPWSVLGGAAAVLLLWLAAQVLEWAWWAPRRMDRALRAQGLRGTRYRLLWGDLTEDQRLVAAALARPVSVNRPHDILPRVAPLFHRAIQEHGKLSFTWFGPTPRVVIADPELAREVLTNKCGDFTKSMQSLSKLLVAGLVILDGEKWAKHRRILNPAFHAEKLKGMLPAFLACCNELVDRWEKQTSASVELTELDVWPEFQNLSGDVISRAAFGVSYEEGRRIFLLQAEQAERLVQSFRINYIPGFSLLPTENNRRMNAVYKEIKTILRGIIEKRQKAVTDGEATKDDLLGLLLESNMNYSDSDGKSEKEITVEEVIGECKVFYFAGMETTGVLLTWTMVLLSMHPEWQDRAREEVLQVFGSQNKPDFNGVARLKAVTMVLYEVLRLYPPVVAMNRRTQRPTKLGGVTYPAGVMLTTSVMFLHRDPALWGSDAGEFNPGRFAEGVSKACSDPGAFVPFSWGPRICIGQNFALLEAKLAVSMILQRFVFELSPAYVHAPYTVLTLHPQHGVPLRLRKLL